MKQFPNKIIHKKIHNPNIIKGFKGKFLGRYNIGFRIKNGCYLSYAQLETFRRGIIRSVKPKQRFNKKNLKYQLGSKTKKKKKNNRKKKTLKPLMIVLQLFSYHTKASTNPNGQRKRCY